MVSIYPSNNKTLFLHTKLIPCINETIKLNAEKETTVSEFRRIMSAVGTILLQSPGWNEGKARNETLGKQGTQKLRAP